MTNKERIRELKLAPKLPANIEDFGIVKIYKDDFDWLIKQAEKVEQYEKALKRIAYCEFTGWSGSDVLGKVTDFANETLKG